MYYSIGEVAEMFDVAPTLIRFWEKKFDILHPRKNARGNRLFTPSDVDNIRLIYHLVKERGMTLAGAQKRMKENPQGLNHDAEVVERLMSVRAMLAELKAELDGKGVLVDEDCGPAAADEDGPLPEVVDAPAVSTETETPARYFVEPTFDFEPDAGSTGAPAAEDTSSGEPEGPRIIEQTLF